jgi:hypothetical protein
MKKSKKKNPLGVRRASGSMRAFGFRLLKPPRARLAAVMMVMMPAQIHNMATVAKMCSTVKPTRVVGIYDQNRVLFLIILFQLQRGGVDTEAQACGLRPIREDVPQMRFAAAAHHFRAHHTVGFVRLKLHF